MLNALLLSLTDTTIHLVLSSGMRDVDVKKTLQSYLDLSLQATDKSASGDSLKPLATDITWFIATSLPLVLSAIVAFDHLRSQEQ